MFVGTGLIGEMGPLEQVSALDPNSNVEERPGTILHEDWGPYETWRSDKKRHTQNLSAESQFISYDVDMDGADELLFITVNGTLIVLDVPTGIEILNMTFGRYRVHGSYLTVGNLDNDEYREIVLFNGTALICLDFMDEVVLWTSEAHLTSNPYRAQGPITLVDPDGDGIDEILVRTNTNYYRLDNNGDIVHNVSLALWGDSMPGGWSYLGRPTRMIVEDLDGDGDLEVFMSGWGWSAIPEILNQGRQFWIVDLASGDIEFSYQFNDTIFFSDPVLFDHDGSFYIAIGLDGYSHGRELLIIDPTNKSWEMFDVDLASTMTTFWITLIPNEDDTVLFLSTNKSCAMAWSYGKKQLLWLHPRGGGYRIESTPVVCDIDNDGDWEILLPIGPVHVYDAVTGEEEIEFEPPPGTYLFNDERTGYGDYDGDGFTEICQGVEYYFAELFKVYYIDTDVLEYDINIPSEDSSLTLYAGIENEVPILLRNMTEKRLPPLIELSLSNDPWGSIGRYQLFPGNGSHHTTVYGLINVSTYTIEFADE
ncbi:MAG: VCBS repeat-containing protein, partial [Thermoplasmata archaeon]|nr:VCBS repeat-containing protein [Thermoplasmata archaeon]